MLHQMMMLLHLEMQLRQQALVSYAHATDPDIRLARLDEVLALNEQLNEVGGILSALLSDPVSRQTLRASEASGLTTSRGILNSDLEEGTTGDGEPGRVAAAGLNAGNVHIVQAGNVDNSENGNSTTNNEHDGETSSGGSNASTQYGIMNSYRATAAEQRSVITSSGSTIQRRNSATTRSMERPERSVEPIISEQSENHTRNGLLNRRNSSQRQFTRNVSQSSEVLASSGQNVTRESITSLSNQSPRSQAATGSTNTTSLPPISSGTSPRTTSGLPAGSNAHRDVMQTLSSSVPNRAANNLSASLDNTSRLESQQSARTITIDTTQGSNQNNPQSARQNQISATRDSAGAIVPNSLARQNQNGDSATNITSNVESESINQPVRARFAPQRRFSRQNSVVINTDTTTASYNESNRDSTQRRSDGGSRMTGVASRRTSVSRSVPNPPTGGQLSGRSQQSVTRATNANRPILDRRNSRDTSNPAESRSNSTYSNSRAQPRSEVNDRTVLNRNNVLPNRSERLDRARRRSEIAQELMNENTDDSRN